MINVLYRFHDEKVADIKEGCIWVGDKTALIEDGYEEGNYIDDQILFFAQNLDEVYDMMMENDEEIIIEWYERNPLRKISGKVIKQIKMLVMELISGSDTDTPKDMLNFIRLCNAEYSIRQATRHFGNALLTNHKKN